MSAAVGISDADLAMLEDYLEGLTVPDERMAEVKIGELRGLIARLRAAEKGEARYLWLRDRVGVDFAYGDFMPYLPTGGYRRDEQDKKQTDDAIDIALERQP